MEPLLTSVESFNEKTEWITGSSGAADSGPHLVVIDDFYADPLKIREIALALPYWQYSPPLASQVGEEIAAQYTDTEAAWVSSALIRYWGRTVRDPQTGTRHAPDSTREYLAELLDEDIDPVGWQQMGDGWNGAFHLLFENWHHHRGAIHHHFRDGDVSPRGWSGLIYLSPDPVVEAGTSIWRNTKTGLCTAEKGIVFKQDDADFELVLRIENRFNRLVLFRENVLHRVEKGFGSNKRDGRLVQTFFFGSRKRGQRQY